MLLVVSTRHSYEITPQPTAMNVVPESQRDIQCIGIESNSSQTVGRKKKKKPLPAESRLDLCTEIIIWQTTVFYIRTFIKVPVPPMFEVTLHISQYKSCRLYL